MSHRSNQLEFQGSKKNNYFEGWYYKLVSEDTLVTLSLIPGITQTKKDPHAFIQIINNKDDKTYYIRYEMNAFSSGTNPFYVRIGNSIFHQDKIHIDIEDEMTLQGDVVFFDSKSIDSNLYEPNIMGPFAYVPNMQCIHAVLSLRHKLQGHLVLNQERIGFDGGLGYMEKDYGTSFPSRYIWMQSNATSTPNTSFFLSYASIPVSFFKFDGLICIFEVEGKQHRFATYHKGSVASLKQQEGVLELRLKQGKLQLHVKVVLSKAHPLKAPQKGSMSETIYETLNGQAQVSLYQKDELIHEREFRALACEISGDFTNKSS